MLFVYKIVLGHIQRCHIFFLEKHFITEKKKHFFIPKKLDFYKSLKFLKEYWNLVLSVGVYKLLLFETNKMHNILFKNVIFRIIIIEFNEQNF